ncbi:MAG: 2-C-methyl-D-erythritol 4-phosphate cytidylyltransferase [Bacteroidales bacterium]|nr:2-C-methyl-D-erythritol 4-phosphate cytidylyltransferase [Bacteroidales bacterium]
MNHCIILAGGIGSRMNLDIPKQYYRVNGIPIIMYSINKFAHSGLIDSIVIVLANEWRGFMEECLSGEQYPCKIHYAEAGKSRQHSVWNGLNIIKRYAMDGDIVLVHDAVRPYFPISNISEGIDACKEYDAALPVIPVKDATYQSSNGVIISSILPRHELYSGQSPECFAFQKFYQAHGRFSDEELSTIRGCAELAFRANLSIKLIPGCEQNFKLTTIEDMKAFELSVNKTFS